MTRGYAFFVAKAGPSDYERRVDTFRKGLRLSAMGVLVNALLAAVKVLAGVLGHSYALVADGIESSMDIASSFIVWMALRYSRRPADRTHPYGHGKAESMAAVLVCLVLIAAAVLIAVHSIGAMRGPRPAPAPYTLAVLALVVVVKESLFRWQQRIGAALRSHAMISEAWHHRTDAMTSLVVFIGIAVAVIGGDGFEHADNWAALAACGVILYNGLRLLRPAVGEVMDAAVPAETEAEVRAAAEAIGGVVNVEKCRIRKSGLNYLMDIHITVDRNLTVHRGHEIAHQVQHALYDSDLPIEDVIVHVEPDDL